MSSLQRSHFERGLYLLVSVEVVRCKGLCLHHFFDLSVGAGSGTRFLFLAVFGSISTCDERARYGLVKRIGAQMLHRVPGGRCLFAADLRFTLRDYLSGEWPRL